MPLTASATSGPGPRWLFGSGTGPDRRRQPRGLVAPRAQGLPAAPPALTRLHLGFQAPPPPARSPPLFVPPWIPPNRAGGRAPAKGAVAAVVTVADRFPAPTARHVT